jgi:hypothetical protein
MCTIDKCTRLNEIIISSVRTSDTLPEQAALVNDDVDDDVVVYNYKMSRMMWHVTLSVYRELMSLLLLLWLLLGRWSA